MLCKTNFYAQQECVFLCVRVPACMIEFGPYWRTVTGVFLSMYTCLLVQRATVTICGFTDAFIATGKILQRLRHIDLLAIQYTPSPAVNWCSSCLTLAIDQRGADLEDPRLTQVLLQRSHAPVKWLLTLVGQHGYQASSVTYVRDGTVLVSRLSYCFSSLMAPCFCCSHTSPFADLRFLTQVLLAAYDKKRNELGCGLLKNGR